MPGDLRRVGGGEDLRLDALPDAALRLLLAGRALLPRSRSVRALHCRNYASMRRGGLQAHTARSMQNRSMNYCFNASAQAHRGAAQLGIDASTHYVLGSQAGVAVRCATRTLQHALQLCNAVLHLRGPGLALLRHALLLQQPALHLRRLQRLHGHDGIYVKPCDRLLEANMLHVANNGQLSQVMCCPSGPWTGLKHPDDGCGTCS